MKALRILHSAFVWLFGALWCVFWMTAAIVVAIFNPEAALAMARLFWARPLFWMAGARLQVDPLPDVDWKRPHIYAMNHQSTVDIPTAFAALPANLRFVAKHTLSYVPFVGWYMRMTGMIVVDRSNRARAVASLVRASEQVRNGASILVFPEGTRSRDRKIHAFKKGPFALALAARVPIVPVAVEASGLVLPANAWTFRPGTIRVKVGQPISTEGRSENDREALAREVREAMIRLHQEIGGQGGAAEEGAPGPDGDGPKALQLPERSEA